jgi:hypothetical protein
MDSPSNNYWWGGTTDINYVYKLGNASDYINNDEAATALKKKWFLGQDLPMPISGGDTADPAASGGKYSYGLIKGPLFEGSLTALDVNQGKAGTCYLIAGMEPVAYTNPSIIEDAFITNPNDIFGVKFYYGGETIYTTVNNQIPVGEDGKVVFSGNLERSLSGEAWVSLMEKAYVQANTQVNLKHDSDWSEEDVKYQNIYKVLKGGEAWPLSQITGDISQLSIRR